jgi:serine/threonine protein kinase
LVHFMVYFVPIIGVAKVMKTGLAHTQIGTPYYMSPEIWRGRCYDKKSDIWSLGCLAYEIAMLRRPFEARDERSLAQKIFHGYFSPMDRGFSADLVDLVRMCLSQDPNHRPSIDEIMRMPCIVRRLNSGLRVSPADAKVDKPLIGTIRVPRDLKLLSHKLPTAAYSPMKPLPQAVLRPVSENEINVRDSQDAPHDRRRGAKSVIDEGNDVAQHAAAHRGDRRRMLPRVEEAQRAPRCQTSPAKLPHIVSPRNRKLLPGHIEMKRDAFPIPSARDRYRSRPTVISNQHEAGGAGGRRRYHFER